jgi:hypothetical protein
MKGQGGLSPLGTAFDLRGKHTGALTSPRPTIKNSFFQIKRKRGKEEKRRVLDK